MKRAGLRREGAAAAGIAGRSSSDSCQFRADAGLQGGPHPLGEFIKRQAPGKKVLTQRGDGPLAIGV